MTLPLDLAAHRARTALVTVPGYFGAGSHCPGLHVVLEPRPREIFKGRGRWAWEYWTGIYDGSMQLGGGSLAHARRIVLDRLGLPRSQPFRLTFGPCA